MPFPIIQRCKTHDKAFEMFDHLKTILSEFGCSGHDETLWFKAIQKTMGEIDERFIPQEKEEDEEWECSRCAATATGVFQDTDGPIKPICDECVRSKEIESFHRFAWA
jgi:hypothetical protein